MTLFAPILSGPGLVDIELRCICSSPWVCYLHFRRSHRFSSLRFTHP